MNHRARLLLITLPIGLIIAGCARAPSSRTTESSDRGTLAGAWRSKISFSTGNLAEAKDLEFLYAYNAGGTMTESSNYDEAANSSPPAYGIWKQTGPGKFETKYVFYTTKAPGPGEGAPNGSDWWPAGHGVLTENIALSADGQTYASTVRLATFDEAGNPVAGGGEGTGSGRRIVF